MGQKKIKTIDLSQEEKALKEKKIEAKKTSPQKTKQEEKKETSAKEAKTIKSKAKKTKAKPKKTHSRRYRMLKTKIDRKKLYALDKAVNLLLKLANAKIDETVEVHFSTRVDKLTGEVKLPHGTGKTQKIAIADKKLIDAVCKGKVDFDILIAKPQMAAQLSKAAKILGPKGLMPNVKNGTITNEPEELKKKLEQGYFKFKTETKAPLLHIVIGKISFGEKKLLENLQALIKAIGPNKIKKAVLTSTQSPGIKLEI